MPISPNIGDNVSPSKEDPELTKVFVSTDGGKVGLGATDRNFGADEG